MRSKILATTALALALGLPTMASAQEGSSDLTRPGSGGLTQQGSSGLTEPGTSSTPGLSSGGTSSVQGFNQQLSELQQRIQRNEGSMDQTQKQQIQRQLDDMQQSLQTMSPSDPNQQLSISQANRSIEQAKQALATDSPGAASHLRDAQQAMSGVSGGSQIDQQSQFPRSPEFGTGAPPSGSGPMGGRSGSGGGS